MTIYLDSEEERIEDIHLGLIEQAIRAAQPTVLLNDLPREESSRIERSKIAGATLEEIPYPRRHDRLNPAKVTDAPEIQSRVVEAARTVGMISPKRSNSIFDLASAPSRRVVDAADNFENQMRILMSGESLDVVDDTIEHLDLARTNLEEELPLPHSDQEMVDVLNEEIIERSLASAPFPNLALEIMQLGLAMETFQTENKLARYKIEGDACKANIDTLLKLSAQLPKMNSDDGSYEVKEEAKLEIQRIAEELREKGIDIFPGMEIGGELTKEQLASANSLINHHIDVNRTNLQEIFTTKISVSIQFLQMMTEVMKKCAEYDDRAKRKMLEIR